MTTSHPDIAPPVEPERIEEFLGTVIGHIGGAATVACTLLGHHLGLYPAMAGAGPLPADAVAATARTHPRLTREWLDQQASAGYVAYDAATDTYELPPEASLAFADPGSQVHVAGGLDTFRALFTDLDDVAAAFRGDGALAWRDHHDCLFRGAREHFRPGYTHHLAQEWVPGCAGITERLVAGGQVADVGCGHGLSTRILAEAYPATTVTGYDSHGASIEMAREIAAGVTNARFEVAEATTVTGSFDLVCLCDCLHDMGDPVGVAAHLLAQLAPSGSILVVEPRAEGSRAANHQSPLAPVGYGASTFLCTPCSLSQPVGRAIGAQGGEPAMRAVFTEAGAGRFTRVAETPLNIAFEAKA